MSTEQSMIVQVDQIQIIDITNAPLTKVLSFTMSLTKKFCVIGTQNGFCLVDNARKSYKRFQDDKNPFKKQSDTGVQIGYALQQRTQVALIPSKRSKNYSKTTVYIFDYHLKTILYSNDFFLPIRQLTLTDNTIIVSNNKRIIIYNYSNDLQQKNQAYYLRMYSSKQSNTHIRYLQMSCQQKLMNNSIQQLDEIGQDKYFQECLCGKYVISSIKPYKLLYCKIYTLNGTKMIQLSIYDQAYDKDYVCESFNYNQPFSFNISQDGNYIAYTENYGKKVIVNKLNQKGIYCVLEISSSIKKCISHGFFLYDDTLWYTAIRRGDNSAGHMHFFKIQKRKQDKQIIKSRYSRYFSLYEKTMADYGICDHLIGPDYYIINGGVYVASVCGTVTEIIDFRITGNHIKKNAENMTKWVEDFL